MGQLKEKPVYPPIKFVFCSTKFVNIKNIDHKFVNIKNIDHNLTY